MSFRIETANVRAALGYAERGWRVLPIRTGSKVPATEHGVHDASSETERIRDWFGGFGSAPDLGLGIACGSASGLVILDVDPRNGGDASFAELMHGRPPLVAPVVETGGGGRHFYFSMTPGVAVKTHKGCLPGLDLLGDGAYAIAPPSRHPSGGTYRWATACGLGDVAPPSLPQWLLDTIFKKSRAAADGNARARKEPYRLPDTLPVGSRREAMFKFLCSMRAKGSEKAELLAAVRALNENGRVEERLPDDEIVKLAADVFERYAPDPRAKARAEQEARAYIEVNLDQELHLTDDGNATRLLKLHGEDLLYVFPWKSWVAFDGRRWIVHAEDAVQRWVRDVPTDLRDEAAAVYAETARIIKERGSPEASAGNVTPPDLEAK
jgi:hypothetical protein